MVLFACRQGETVAVVENVENDLFLLLALTATKSILLTKKK